MTAEARRESLASSLAAHGVPEHLHDGLIAYVVDGRQTGGFLRACLENNLVDAAMRAGADLTIEELRSVAKWIFNDAPPRCWGSPGVVKTWRGEL